MERLKAFNLFESLLRPETLNPILKIKLALMLESHANVERNNKAALIFVAGFIWQKWNI